MRREILRKKWSCDLWMLVAHNYGAGRCHKILEYIKWTWRHASWFIYALYLQLDFKNERPLVRAWGSCAVTARAVTAINTWAPWHVGPTARGPTRQRQSLFVLVRDLQGVYSDGHTWDNHQGNMLSTTRSPVLQIETIHDAPWPVSFLAYARKESCG